jgi:hypothetical protein
MDYDDRQEEEDIPNNVVVLNGTVRCAKELPLLASDERDGRAFFRVLHVEGGSKSTMFRCKTMIFSSEMAADVAAPVWADGAFRFEMIVPEDDCGAQELSGEILVAVYRSRWQGGNDFIGQASFELSRLVSMDVGYPGDIEHNTVKGSYDLIDRQGRVAGDSAEVEARLEFSWRVPPSRPQTKAATEGPAPPSPARSRSSAKARRPASGGSTGGIRRIQSANSAKKKTEQLRIDLENKALQARIGRNGTQAGKERMEAMYRKTPAAGAGAGAGSGKNPGGAAASRTAAASASLAAKSPGELQALLAQTKARAAGAEKENTTLRAQAAKERALGKRMEGDIRRIRAQEMGIVCYGTDEPIVDSLAIDRDSIADSELKEMLGEHDALQQSRRALRRRAVQSKAACADAAHRLQLSEKKLRTAWDNVNATANEGGEMQNEGYSLSREIVTLKAELLSLEADVSQDANSPVRDEINEEKMINSNLKAKLGLAKEDLDKALYERDICSDRLSALKEEGVMVHLKTVTTTLRSAYYRCQRRERIDGLNHKAEAFELEYMKHCPEY